MRPARTVEQGASFFVKKFDSKSFAFENDRRSFDGVRLMPGAVADVNLVSQGVERHRRHDRAGRKTVRKSAASRVQSDRDFAGDAIARALFVNVRDFVGRLREVVAAVNDEHAHRVVAAEVAIAVGEREGE